MRTSEIGACAFRITRLDNDGTPDFDNPTGTLAVCGGITAVTHSFEVEEGTAIFQKDSCGAGCVNIKKDDVEKWVNFTITVCKDAYEIWEILGLAAAFPGSGPTAGQILGIGHTMAAGCAVVTKPRVAIELWAEQYDCDELVEGAPYKRHVFTKAVMSPQGYDHGSDPSLPVFSGRAFNNSNIGDGPHGDLDILATNNFVGAYAKLDDTALPDCPDDFGYQATPPTGS